MIKFISSPFAKLFFFFVGFIGFMSTLGSISHTFRAVFGHVFGNWFQFGLLPSLLLFLLGNGLLGLAVWMTKTAKMKAPILLLLRKADFSLLVIFSLWMQLYLLFYTYARWEGLSPFFLLTFVYILFILVLAEFVARLRDRKLARTLYWIQFFRTYPIWRLFGFTFALLLTGNLTYLILLTPLFRNRAILGVWPQFILVFTNPIDPYQWMIELAYIMAVFHGLSLAALTYFAAYMLRLSTKYNAANEDKIRSERFKSELITNVSHDIRTPLTSVINYVDLLKQENLQGQAAEYMQALDRKSNRLKILIDDLMDASKAGTGNVVISKETIKLEEIVGQVAGEFEDVFLERDLTLVLIQPEEPIFVSTDSRHLWRVLENLFSNVAKYALSGTRAFAEIGLHEDGKPFFTLKNTSQNPIELSGEEVTRHFIRGDQGRQSEGNGLGLYIAKNLIEYMGDTFQIHVTGDLFEVEIMFSKSDEASFM